MKTLTHTLACLIVAGGACGLAGFGCSKDEKAATKKSDTMTPTTMPAVTASAAAPALKEADMTHTVEMDAPMFASMPMDATAKPATTLKKGEKVMVMMPRGKYQQVTTQAGMKGYIPTTAIKPIGG